MFKNVPNIHTMYVSKKKKSQLGMLSMFSKCQTRKVEIHQNCILIRNSVWPSGSGAACIAKHITLRNQVCEIIYRYTAPSAMNCKDRA